MIFDDFHFYVCYVTFLPKVFHEVFSVSASNFTV